MTSPHVELSAWRKKWLCIDDDVCSFEGGSPIISNVENPVNDAVLDEPPACYLCGTGSQQLWRSENSNGHSSSSFRHSNVSNTVVAAEINTSSTEPQLSTSSRKLHASISQRDWMTVREILTCREAHILALRVDDEPPSGRRRTPLAAACLYGAPTEIVRLLLAIEPRCFGMADADGNLPLHLACAERLSSSSSSSKSKFLTPTDIETLRVLLQFDPSSATCRNHKLETPLQVALANPQKLPSQWFVEILKACPESGTYENGNGDHPLHFVGKAAVGGEVVRQILDVQPSAIWTLNRYGASPILLASHRGAPIDVLKVLVAACPAMVPKKDGRGRCSLMVLWDSHTSARKVMSKFVHQEYQRAARNRRNLQCLQRLEDMKGTQREWWEKLKLLLYAVKNKSIQGYERDVKHSHSNDNGNGNDSNWGILHAAAGYHNCPPDLLAFMCKHYSKEVDRPEGMDGHLPLHLAAGAPFTPLRGNETNKTSLEILIEQNPKNLLRKDSKGRIPLHVALLSGKRWHQGIEELINADMSTLRIADTSTKLYPFMIPGPLLVPNKVDTKKIFSIDEASTNVNSLLRKDYSILESQEFSPRASKLTEVDEKTILETIYLLLKKDPMTVAVGLQIEPPDPEKKILRDTNFKLRQKKKKLRKELLSICKQLDVVDKMHEIKTATITNEIKHIKRESTVNSSNEVKRSALKRANTIGAARKKYIPARVKFIPDSIVEFSDRESENRNNPYCSDISSDDCSFSD